MNDFETAAREGAAHGAPTADLVTSVFARDCTSREAFEDVTGKWASLALIALGEGTYRFGELRRRVQGVSEKMLSQALQALERDGFLTRTVVTAIPPRVEYNLTAMGERLATQLRSLADVLEATTAEVGQARAQYDQRATQGGPDAR